MQESTIPDYDMGGVVRGPSGTRLEGIGRPSNIYRSADGSWVVIAANQDTAFPPAVRGEATSSWPPMNGLSTTRPAVAIRTNSTPSSANGRRYVSPATSSKPLGAAGVIAGSINTAEVVYDPQFLARGMLVEHFDERIGRNVLGPGVVPVLSESPGGVRSADRLGPASTTPRYTATCWASATPTSPN